MGYSSASLLLKTAVMFVVKPEQKPLLSEAYLSLHEPGYSVKIVEFVREKNRIQTESAPVPNSKGSEIPTVDTGAQPTRNLSESVSPLR